MNAKLFDESDQLQLQNCLFGIFRLIQGEYKQKYIYKYIGRLLLRNWHTTCVGATQRTQVCTHNIELKTTRQIWGIWKLRLAYSPETPNLGQNRWCFVPCDLEIWWMTLENNRASLLCCFKLSATFHSHWWIQTGVTVRKRPIWVKIDDFFSHVTLQFDIWPWKTIGHLFYFKLCTSFRSHQWFQTWVTVRKRPIWVKFDDF